MPTSITSSGITFDDATTQTTSALAAGAIGATQLASAAVTAAKLDGAQTGEAPVYGCRAWVNFDGRKDTTGATSTANTNRLIRASGNVTSVLRNGAGDYTITFTTAMPDENYCVTTGFATAGAPSTSYDGSASIYSAATVTASSVRVWASQGGGPGIGEEAEYFAVAIFR